MSRVTSLRYGYNTNGFPHHRLTLDVHHLDPFRATPREVEAVAAGLRRHRLEPAIETGARFVLDPRRKHEPNLLSPDPQGRARRLDFLRRCVRIGADLGARVVSLWAGRPPAGEERSALEGRLAEGVGRVCDEAAGLGLSVALEPEPGMLVETLAEYRKIRKAIGRPNLGLCLDLGHLYCTGETPVAPFVREFGGEILTAHVEDAPRGAHEHRMFGEGEVDLPEALTGFREIGYRGLLNVELSRHGHEAPSAARRAIDALREAEVSPQG
jgi:L-ribulose-5-phosphate 3-epimerase